MARLPLEGIRLADFCWVGAGPFATKLLADHGAQVIKIESSLRPDNLRNSPPFRGRPGSLDRSGYFASRNTSKLSFALNMKHPKAVEVAKRLIAVSDVVSNSFTPGVLAKWGLSYEEVRQIRPDIIYIDMPMQGTTGPHRHHMGFGSTIAALSGINHLTGYPDREPLGTGTNYPDHLPNPGHAAFAILAALWHRRRTGEGQYIELSQLESTINVIGPALMQASFTGRSPMRMGNQHPSAAPHGVYPCAGEDNWCAIAVMDDDAWQRLVQVMGEPEWAKEERWRSAAGRLQDRDELDRRLAEWTRGWDRYALMHRLQQAGIPAYAVQSSQDLVERDEHLKAREYWQRLEHPEMGTVIQNAVPVHLSRTPGQLRWAAPRLGEHTEYVCREVIGMDEDEYRALAEDGVFV